MQLQLNLNLDYYCHFFCLGPKVWESLLHDVLNQGNEQNKESKLNQTTEQLLDLEHEKELNTWKIHTSFWISLHMIHMQVKVYFMVKSSYVLDIQEIKIMFLKKQEK